MSATWEWARRWQALLYEHMRENTAAHEILRAAKTPAEERMAAKRARKHVRRMIQIERELRS